MHTLSEHYVVTMEPTEKLYYSSLNVLIGFHLSLDSKAIGSELLKEEVKGEQDYHRKKSIYLFRRTHVGNTVC